MSSLASFLNIMVKKREHDLEASLADERARRTQAGEVARRNGTE
jgi:hypothetical protein